MSPIDGMAIVVSIYIAITQLTTIKVAAREVPFSKYRDLLTRNYSKRWLLHMSERQSSTNPYCNICCLNITTNGILKDCGYHTLCIYKKDETRPHCRGFMAVKFTEGEKYMILDAHNTVRNKVASGSEKRGANGSQPSAANMRRLEWDNELASIAQRWVAQCSPMPDRCRDVERFPVGQNIAFDYASKSNHLSFILNWSDKVNLVNKATLSAFSPTLHSDVREYTQLVWAESYKVGCARAVFQSDWGPDVVYKEMLVCNYGPSGNIPGQPVYIRGSPCSACYVGTKCEAEYPSLCGRSGTNEIAEITRKPDSDTRDIKKTTADEDTCALDSNKNYNGEVLKFNFAYKTYTLLLPIGILYDYCIY
ncbi:venom allergen 3-like [Coccinella septempunctata]|uniref:venom allergen 3-like n=1 Tax=Coccinella septempunctata TaxID=41139 RepID=UPI001D08B9F1|nr:venom allergen 3-like [Coccinella septempunctata]